MINLYIILLSVFGIAGEFSWHLSSDQEMVDQAIDNLYNYQLDLSNMQFKELINANSYHPLPHFMHLVVNWKN